jgi:hypothetical protein
MDKNLTAYDHAILRQFGGTNERKTLYQLSLKVPFDDVVLAERLEKLENLGYMKSHNRNGVTVYRRL